jgi:endonuclease YncB( thermonuclease family)
MYEYRATVLDIIDGDTLRAEVHLGCDVSIRMTIRLYGINAPEMSTDEGKAAKAYVVEWISTNAPQGIFVLRTIKDHKEKYGRYLGLVVSNVAEETLNDALIRTGHAVKYFGGSR